MTEAGTEVNLSKQKENIDFMNIIHINDGETKCIYE